MFGGYVKSVFICDLVAVNVETTGAAHFELCVGLQHRNTDFLSNIFKVTNNWWIGRDSSDGIAARYGMDGPRIESRWERDVPNPSRPALGPTQPPTKWVLVLYGVKRPGRGVDHPPHLTPRLKKE
jgi:hypothetical protein